MSWKLNTEVIPVPTDEPTPFVEQYLEIQADNVSLNGSLQRLQLGEKWQVTMGWHYLTAVQYQQLIRIFRSGPVAYFNDNSIYAGGVLSFTGLATFSEGKYIPNTKLYRDLSVVIRQV